MIQFDIFASCEKNEPEAPNSRHHFDINLSNSKQWRFTLDLASTGYM